MNEPTDSINPPKESTIGMRGRLFIGFGSILFILLIAITILLVKVTIVGNSADKVINSDLPTYDNLLELGSHIYQSQLATIGWVLNHDPDDKIDFNNSWKQIENLRDTLDEDSKNWSSTTLKQWEDAKALLLQAKPLELKIIEDPAAATLITSQLKPLMNSLLTIIDGPRDANGLRDGGLYNAKYNIVRDGTHAIITNINSLKVIEYILLVIGVIVALLIAIYTTRSIFSYVNVFRNQSKRVAAGDLTQRITIQSRDEMGLLGQDLNTMTSGLATITKQITEACHHMVTMLAEVKQAVDSQSSGASEQASSINQITASLEEIEKSSTQTIEKAKSLGEAAERTREKGKLGLEAVEQSVNGMKIVRDKVQTISQTILDLSNQTKQVGEITAVVSALAQQSKMLALNASIEAAKAGEAGKGFAVVAAEVKNLAEQSEQSTAQVQKILEDIRHATEKAVIAMEEGTKGVDIGTGLVEQTGEIVRSLSEVIHEASIATQQIEAAIRQEGIGIEQITAGMNEINQVTSSSVESVKQTTEAIDNLGTIANSLKKYTDVYKV